MAKFLFVLSRGLEDPTRATRAFQLAKVAKAKNHEVHVFLLMTVFTTHKGVLQIMLRLLQVMMQKHILMNFKRKKYLFMYEYPVLELVS